MSPAEQDRTADVTPGRIVLLNGASSSGKSSLAGELLEVFDDPWFHLPVDAFGAMRSRKDLPRPELEAMFRRTRQGYQGAVAAMARAGNSVVADHVPSEPWQLADILEQWAGLDVSAALIGSTHACGGPGHP